MSAAKAVSFFNINFVVGNEIFKDKRILVAICKRRAINECINSFFLALQEASARSKTAQNFIPASEKNPAHEPNPNLYTTADSSM